MTARNASVNVKNVTARNANVNARTANAVAVASVKENASVNLHYLSDNNYSYLFQ